MTPKVLQDLTKLLKRHITLTLTVKQISLNILSIHVNKNYYGVQENKKEI